MSTPPNEYSWWAMPIVGTSLVVLGLLGIPNYVWYGTAYNVLALFMMVFLK